jgi:hypothetical protein
MRSALEDDLSTVTEMAMVECRIRVACGWILHGASELLSWARENIDYTDVLVEDWPNYVEGGPFYQGPHTMCLERWRFWIGRFEEAGKEEARLSNEIRAGVIETAQLMRRIEAEMADTLPAKRIPPESRFVLLTKQYRDI